MGGGLGQQGAADGYEGGFRGSGRKLLGMRRGFRSSRRELLGVRGGGSGVLGGS